MKAIYRIVAALGALLIFPVLYFQKIIHLVIELGFMEGYFDDAFSINQTVNFFKNNGGAPDLSSFSLSPNVAEVLAPLKKPAVVTLVFACLFLAMTLAIFFCSAFTNAKKVNLVFSVIGAIAVIGTIASFNSMGDMIISGEVSLGSIVNAVMADSESTLAGIGAILGLGNAVSFIGKPIVIQLGTAFVLSIIIFVGEALWALAFILIGLDEYKAPKEKKAKKAKEAKADKKNA